MEDRHTDIGMKRVENEIKGEIEKLNLRKIIAEEKIEYKELEQERKKLNNEEDDILSKIEKTDDNMLIDMTAKQEKRLLEIHSQVSVIKNKIKIGQITAYQKIKELLA